MRDHVGSFFSENKKKKFVFPESWKNIRSCNKELHENCI